MHDFICIDFETTGWVTSQRSLPWQIGMARFSGEGFRQVAQWESLLQIPASQEFNPYTPGRWAKIREELSQAPTLLSLWPQIHQFMGDCRVMVAHHTATERGILNDFFPCSLQGIIWLDTVNIARVAYPRQRDYKLENLLPNLGMTPRAQKLCPEREPHDALYDAVACGVLLQHILAYEPWKSAKPEVLARVN